MLPTQDDHSASEAHDLETYRGGEGPLRLSPRFRRIDLPDARRIEVVEGTVSLGDDGLALDAKARWADSPGYVFVLMALGLIVQFGMHLVGFIAKRRTVAAAAT